MRIASIASILLGGIIADSALATKSTTLAGTSFGLDPLGIVQSSGNEVLTFPLFDPSNAHTGNSYLSVAYPAARPNSTDRQYTVFYYGYTLADKTKYHAQIWGKSPTNSGECYISIGFRDNSGNLLNLTDGAVVKSKYEKYEITVNSGSKEDKSGTGAAYFYVSCLGQGQAETVFLDDFSVTKLT